MTTITDIPFWVFILLVVFQAKHLIADYYLQFPYMYENKGKPTGWLTPLLNHTYIHAGMTLVVIGFAGEIIFPTTTIKTIAIILSCVTLFDATTHFLTDRWKATRGRTPAESKFWTDLGIDQMIHHTVGIIIVAFFWWMNTNV